MNIQLLKLEYEEKGWNEEFFENRKLRYSSVDRTQLEFERGKNFVITQLLVPLMNSDALPMTSLSVLIMDDDCRRGNRLLRRWRNELNTAPAVGFLLHVEVLIQVNSMGKLVGLDRHYAAKTKDACCLSLKVYEHSFGFFATSIMKRPEKQLFMSGNRLLLGHFEIALKATDASRGNKRANQHSATHRIYNYHGFYRIEIKKTKIYVKTSWWRYVIKPL